MGLRRDGVKPSPCRSKKFVQIGRVVYIVDGKYKGRLAAIIDIIDTNRVLVDGPCSDVPRHAIELCEVQLTSFVIKIFRSQRSKLVRQAWVEGNITARFQKSEWFKNVHKGELKSQMNDFDRFKAGRVKQIRNKIVAKAVNVQDRLEKNIHREKKIAAANKRGKRVVYAKGAVAQKKNTARLARRAEVAARPKPKTTIKKKPNPKVMKLLAARKTQKKATEAAVKASKKPANMAAAKKELLRRRRATVLRRPVKSFKANVLANKGIRKPTVKAQLAKAKA